MNATPITPFLDVSIRAELLEARANELESRVAELERAVGRDRLALLVHGADYDRVIAAMTIANSAAAMGAEVRVFLAFWAPLVLRRPKARPSGWFARLLAWLLPGSAEALPLSRMHLGGAGAAVMRRRMRRLGHADMGEQLAMAAELGVEILVCEQSLELLGMTMADLIDYPGLSSCGAATFVGHAMDAKASMFF